MGLSFTKSFGENDLYQSHKLLDRLDKITEDATHHFAKNFLSADTVPDFHDIQIETCNRCNNDCPFCPANRNNDTRKPTFMDEELFYSIIDQLYAMDYHGTISLFSNNEPLLDGRILKFVEYARKRLPNAVHYLYTNGILLNAEKFSALVKNLDVLVIDNYDDNFQLTPPVEKTLTDFQSLPPQVYADSSCEVTISMRKKNQKLNTRGGTAPNRINESDKFRPNSPCILPFTQIIVRPDGTVAKCCNDPLTKITLGDLNKQTFREIWRGRAYQDLRKEMYFNGRQNIAGCEFCDIFGLYNYLPTYAASNEYKRLADEIFFRKNLGQIYIFDTTNVSQTIFNTLKIYGTSSDGFIDVRRERVNTQDDRKFVTFEQAIAEQAFIVFPAPYYPDQIFDIIHGAGYQYAKDYLIFPAGL